MKTENCHGNLKKNPKYHKIEKNQQNFKIKNVKSIRVKEYQENHLKNKNKLTLI